MPTDLKRDSIGRDACESLSLQPSPVRPRRAAPAPDQATAARPGEQQMLPPGGHTPDTGPTKVRHRFRA